MRVIFFMSDLTCFEGGKMRAFYVSSLLLFLGAVSGPVLADDAAAAFTCTGQVNPAHFVSHGTDAQGRGEGKSQEFQINVYTPDSRVAFLGIKDPVICTATMTSKHRITGGRADINSVYSDYNRQSSSRPDVQILRKYISVSTGVPQTNSITFRFSISTDEYKGTIGATFLINYVATD